MRGFKSLLVVVASVISLNGVLSEIDPYQVSNEICETPGCIKAATMILDSLNPAVHPCDNFYQFACGGFLEKTEIPEDKSWVARYVTIEDTVQENLKKLFKEPVSPNEPAPFALLKKLYKSCTDTGAIESEGLTTLKDILEDSGGWPVLEEAWDDSKFDWKKLVYKFRRLGFDFDYFLDFDMDADPLNSTRRMIMLDQADLGLNQEILVKGFDSNEVKAYYQYMVNTAVLFGANRRAAEKDMKDALDFEISLAKFSLPLEKRRNPRDLHHPITIGELQLKHPSIPWRQYVSVLLGIPEIQINDDEVVNVGVPQFLGNLEKLLKRTPLKVQANYGMWRAIKSVVPYLNNAMKQENLKYDRVLKGVNQREPVWKECVNTLSQDMSILTGALYARRYFTPESREHVREIMYNIQRTFAKLLEEVEWMDDVTKRSALEKAAYIVPYVAYPDEVLDDQVLENYFSKLQLNSDGFLSQMLEVSKFNTDKSFGKLRKAVDKTDWSTRSSPATVNAFYNPAENGIQFPAAILQSVYYTHDRPNYLNYGGVGFLVGHEITHGFDDQGRHYDKDGNLVDWWAKETEEAFSKKAQCIIDQYGNYTVPEVGLNLNGVTTQGENIADNGGVKEAYLAYQAWVEQNGPEPRLPGLNLTSNQLFWISSANIWCTKFRPEFLKLNVLTNAHAPDEYRVIGPLSNMKYFARDFSCPSGSRMNPEHKCQVW